MDEELALHGEGEIPLRHYAPEFTCLLGIQDGSPEVTKVIIAVEIRGCSVALSKKSTRHGGLCPNIKRERII